MIVYAGARLHTYMYTMFPLIFICRARIRIL